MQKILITLSILCTQLLVAQNTSEKLTIKGNTIDVVITNATSDKGTINVALFDENSFLKSDPIMALSTPIIKGVGKVTFTYVPEGTYAILCFHDENENLQMDFDTNGMPLEDYGATNNVISYGPPQFVDAKFEVTNKPLTFEINLQ